MLWRSVNHVKYKSAINYRQYTVKVFKGPLSRHLTMHCKHLVYDSSILEGGGGGGGGIYWQPCTQGIEGKVYMCYTCVCE